MRRSSAPSSSAMPHCASVFAVGMHLCIFECIFFYFRWITWCGQLGSGGGSIQAGGARFVLHSGVPDYPYGWIEIGPRRAPHAL